MNEQKEIRAIIGLGNPGSKHARQRHNIGFMICDALAERAHVDWQSKDLFQMAQLPHNGKQILLIKPQTFMNASGKVLPFLQKKGIAPEQILVVHDELEKPFGSITFAFGGSARGHNGLRSIIECIGKDFHRLRFGIGRPARKEDVGTWVLSNFNEPADELDALIEDAGDAIEGGIKD